MTYRVLLAEDDRFLRKAAAITLERHGFEVETADNGADALRQAREARPDLVLLDLIMPAMQGFEVLRALKADPATAAIPVIVLTNLSQEKDRADLLSHGAAAYLVKANVSLEQLADVVMRTVGRTA